MVNQRFQQGQAIAQSCEIKKTSEQIARLAIIAIVAAIGIIGVVETFVIPLQQQQQAEARGCDPSKQPGSFAFNASKGRCFGH
jgi:hypothetical protein